MKVFVNLPGQLVVEGAGVRLVADAVIHVARNLATADAVLARETNHAASIHLSIPSGLFSKMLFTLMVNCFLRPLQNQVSRNPPAIH
jgi:hypothetical protein